jgi:3D (Asp-Asp-Asp) domain-containing protein/peptidoglycan hydrolase CwlO-like protein
LRARAESLGRSEQGALLELYALESSLGRAQRQAENLRSSSTALAERAAAARRSAVIVRDSLALSHGRVATAVRRLYVEGDADPIAVLLGATSLDEALAGLESLERATDRNRQLVSDLGRQLTRLRVVEHRLAARRAALADSLAAAEAAERELGQRVTAKRSYLAALRRERALTHARVAALEVRAQAAERASTRLAAAAASAPVDKPLLRVDGPGAAGTRTLVVDAVAYHLPGRTASGLPVGPGVVAVDPSVIPLGTRMYVPGYGPAIAADVGSAIKGTLIDLWFPTTAQARAWGRRTVMITLYP